MRIHYRILAVLMALMVTLSSAGIAVSKHICDNVVQNIAINHPAKPCPHKTGSIMISCPVHGTMSIIPEKTDNDCCKDTTDYITDDRPKNVTLSDFSINPHFFLLYLISFTDFTNNNVISKLKSSSFTSEIPPLIDREKYILIESFLL